MKKNRVHERSVSTGFAAAKETLEKKEVEIIEERIAKEPTHIEEYRPTRILWYSTETLSNDQTTGLKMVFGEDLEIDEVYDVPCHINSIKERIKKADIVALGIKSHERVTDVMVPFIEADPKKSAAWNFIYTVIDEKTKVCWRYYRGQEAFAQEPDLYASSKLVSYSQIRSWNELVKGYTDYFWAAFMPQKPMEPAYIAMLLDDGDDKKRFYRYIFVEEHEFNAEDRPLLRHWINANTLESYSTGDFDKLERTSKELFPNDIVLGYRYIESDIRERLDKDPDAEIDWASEPIGGYFEALYLRDFNIPCLGDAASM